MTHKKAILLIIIGLLFCLGCVGALYYAANQSIDDSFSTIEKPFSMVQAYDGKAKVVRFHDTETGVICYEWNLKFSCVFPKK